MRQSTQECLFKDHVHVLWKVLHDLHDKAFDLSSSSASMPSDAQTVPTAPLSS
jgi:hypothetical protein